MARSPEHNGVSAALAWAAAVVLFPTLIATATMANAVETYTPTHELADDTSIPSPRCQAGAQITASS